MSSRTRRQAAAEQSSDEEEGPSQPSQPAEPQYIPSSSDLADAHEDYQRFTFLQAVMQRGFMNESDAKAMYRKLTESSDDSEYDAFLADVNEPLTFLNLKLKRMHFNLDNEWYIGFINELPDETAKLASSLKIPQRYYFQSLLEAIAMAENSPDGKPYVRSTDAINVSMSQATMTQLSQIDSSSQATANMRLTLSEKQDTLKQLVQEGWIAKTPGQAGAVSVGVRSYMELGSYLMDLDMPDSTKIVWSKFL